MLNPKIIHEVDQKRIAGFLLRANPNEVVQPFPVSCGSAVIHFLFFIPEV